MSPVNKDDILCQAELLGHPDAPEPSSAVEMEGCGDAIPQLTVESSVVFFGSLIVKRIGKERIWR